VILYLDTSSLVKLYVEEEGSDDVQALVDDATLIATSHVAYPEARAALARRRRERALSPRSFTAAKRAFETDWIRYVAIEVQGSLCREAGDLAERYRLRGFDSVHLASFAEMLRGLQGRADVRFSSFDDRLNQAARQLSRTIG
jgi:predicted nucleic acid-binding protein